MHKVCGDIQLVECQDTAVTVTEQECSEGFKQVIDTCRWQH